jgi:hypothetical protein
MERLSLGQGVFYLATGLRPLLKGRILPVYIVDVMAELALIGGWLAASRPNRV